MIEIRRISGSVIRKAAVDFRLIAVRRLARFRVTVVAATLLGWKVTSTMAHRLHVYSPRDTVGKSRRSGFTDRPLRAESFGLTPHEAFELTFRPCERVLHGFALVEAHAHLGQRRLDIDLLSDLRRRWRCGDR